MNKKVLILAWLVPICLLMSCSSPTGKEESSAGVSEALPVSAEDETIPLAQDEPEIKEEKSKALVEEGRDYYYARNGKIKDNDKALELFQQAAEYDDANAWYYIGRIAEGEKNYEDAYEAYQKAIDLDNSLALLAMGRLYMEGNGVDVDYEKAMSLYEESIAAGCMEAHIGLGDFYQYGYGTDKDGSQAVVNYLDVVNEGAEPEWQVQAYNELSYIYFLGLQSVEKNIERSLEYNMAANDIASAWTVDYMVYIAMIYEQGAGDEDNAREWIERAASSVQPNDASGYGNLGWAYREGIGVNQDGEKAIEYYQKQGEAGDSLGFYNIALMYQNGNGVSQDGEKAIEYYQKQGEIDPTGYSNVGYMYQHGLGVSVDYEQAMEWYEKAASLGSATAMNQIGYMYRNGVGRAIDYEKAMEWYLKSVQTGGDDTAMVNIGTMYHEGLGVEQDYRTEFEWYTRALKRNKLNENIKENATDSIRHLVDEGIISPEEAAPYLD